MCPNKTIDQYTLVLEIPPDGENGQTIRAVAENTAVKSYAEVQLTHDQVILLLSQVHGGDEAMANTLMEQLREFHLLELHSSGTTLCIFNAIELGRVHTNDM